LVLRKRRCRVGGVDLGYVAVHAVAWTLADLADGHMTWACGCAAVVYASPLPAGCRVLVRPAAVR
jgi:hypothetical protein